LNPVKTLPETVEMNVISVKEERPLKGKTPMEWFLTTTEAVTSPDEAYEYAGEYM
jgi:hypothetical protein